jgi:uncharacterized membrane protein YdjX (TVP38/TMEM64 family)
MARRLEIKGGMLRGVSGGGRGFKAVGVLTIIVIAGLAIAGTRAGDVAATVAQFLDLSGAWISANPLLAAATFVASTAAARLAPLPTGAMMTVMGGYLFGTVVGAALAAVGATAAAAVAYVAGRPLFAGVVEKHLGSQFSAVEREITARGFNYLLALRLLPIIPGWLVNLLPLAFAMRLRTIALATFLGLLPISLVFASFGAALAMMGAAPEPVSAEMLRWNVVLPLAGLAALALLPVVLRRFGRWNDNVAVRLRPASESSGSSGSDSEPPRRSLGRKLR